MEIVWGGWSGANVFVSYCVLLWWRELLHMFYELVDNRQVILRFVRVWTLSTYYELVFSV